MTARNIYFEVFLLCSFALLVLAAAQAVNTTTELTSSPQDDNDRGKRKQPRPAENSKPSVTRTPLPTESTEENIEPETSQEEIEQHMAHPDEVNEPQATPTATPSPQIQETAKPLDIGTIAERLDKIRKKFEKRKDQLKQALISVNQSLNEIHSREMEVEVYMKQMGSEKNRRSFPTTKFDAYLEGLGLGRKYKDMWITDWNGKQVEFEIAPRRPEAHSVSRLSFGVVPDEDCVATELYLKIMNNNEAIITQRYQLTVNAAARQNTTLPFQVLFDSIKVVVVKTNRHSPRACLPAFRIYQYYDLLPQADI